MSNLEFLNFGKQRHQTRLLGVLANLTNKWHHWISGDILHQNQGLCFIKLKISKFDFFDLTLT